MATFDPVQTDRCEIVRSQEQLTIPADQAIQAGQLVRHDVTTGKFTLGNGTTATEANIYGVATRKVAAGEPLTAVKRGIIDGLDLVALAFGAKVYASDTDGAMSATAGTVSVQIGRVISGTAVSLGTTYDKLLEVDVRA